MRRGGFTLIEVIAVIVLLGLVTGAAAWVLTDNARHSTRGKVVEEIAHADRMTRFTAECLGRRCVLRLDLDRQRIRRLIDDEHGRQVLHGLKVPDGYRISRVVLGRAFASGRNTDRWRRRRIDMGEVDIPFSAGGRSMSYALRLDSDDGRVWLIFAGLTGQVTQLHDEQEVNNLFTAIAKARPDAS